MRLSRVRAFFRLRRSGRRRRTSRGGGADAELEGTRAVASRPRGADGPDKMRWPQVDQPISTRAADLLGRGPFVQRVVQVLDEMRVLEDSSVLGLVGPWGSGKSSLINLVCEQIGASWQVRRASSWAPPDVSKP
jgi:KAP-like P-loop domain-containing protein